MGLIGQGMTILLSHSTRDRLFVKRLAEHLGAEGFKPWLCETAIDAGANWVEEM